MLLFYVVLVGSVIVTVLLSLLLFLWDFDKLGTASHHCGENLEFYPHKYQVRMLLMFQALESSCAPDGNRTQILVAGEIL